MLEKTLESPLVCKEIKPINPKGNQSWIFIGRTDANAPMLWPPDTKIWLLGKDPDAEKDWRQEKGATEDEMVGWHHLLTGHEFEQAPRVGDGQGSLVCCSPWGCKELDMTEQLNWTSPFPFLKNHGGNQSCHFIQRFCLCLHENSIANGLCKEPGDLNSGWSFFSDHSVSLKKVNLPSWTSVFLTW